LTKIGDSVFFYRGITRTFAYIDSTTQADGNNYVNGAGLTGDVFTITRTGLPAVTATIPLSSKLNFTDTLSMLAAYINSSGYGLVKSGHLLGVDSSFVATRNFVQALPSYSINNSDITAWGTAYNKRPINLTVNRRRNEIGAINSCRWIAANGNVY
jgi:hypothetical protein